MKLAMVASMVTASALCPLTALAAADAIVYPAHIKEIVTGWNSDDLSVATDVPIVNPANCPLNDYYQSAYNAPGRASHFAAALTAFANKTLVTLAISGSTCTYTGRPLLMSVAPSW